MTQLIMFYNKSHYVERTCVSRVANPNECMPCCAYPLESAVGYRGFVAASVQIKP